jgi:hypothetical protein|tara:strand:- start:47 stop:415 length:369 start_codon:yes stop_codon:yes gene_type:complete
MKNNKIEKLLDKDRAAKEKIENFAELLGALDQTDQKKKLLWKEIYENAVSDRERASVLFTEAYKAMGASSTDHAAIGTTMTKYLERMCKSNEQVLRLAELIAKSEQMEANVDPEEIFNKISE